ncbi:hypothetical protein ACFSQJ_02125 [Croceitalea marina]|uniref:Secreted protein n=1 Tax=Croceitalea marina TaxID=1775166 RepID=A0ABW5MTL6_9FLAO
MKPIVRTLGLFLFAALLLFKVAGLHSFTHLENTDEISDCVVCHMATEEQEDVYFLPLDLNLEFSTFYYLTEGNVFAYQFLNGKTHLTFQYSRPPPFLSLIS